MKAQAANITSIRQLHRLHSARGARGRAQLRCVHRVFSACLRTLVAVYSIEVESRHCMTAHAASSLVESMGWGLHLSALILLIFLVLAASRCVLSLSFTWHAHGMYCSPSATTTQQYFDYCGKRTPARKWWRRFYAGALALNTA